MKKLIRARSVRPYTNGSKTNLAWCQKLKGVYIIREKKRGAKKWETVYVGHSLYSLYSTIIRHFQEWNDTAQPEGRVTYKQFLDFRQYLVTVLITPEADALKWEAFYIRKFNPRDNTNSEQFNLPRGREFKLFNDTDEATPALPVSDIVDDYLTPLCEAPF
jgi:hypothetical protein